MPSSIATGVSLVNIRLLPSSTSDFHVAFSYDKQSTIRINLVQSEIEQDILIKWRSQSSAT